MTVTVSLTGIAPFIEHELDTAMRLLVLEADKAIKENTPVDTGRLAASWMIGKNGDTSGNPVPPGKYVGISRPKGSNFQPSKVTAGTTYSIHNNLPYAEANCGYSSGFPASWKGQFKSGNKAKGEGPKVKPGWFELIAKNLGPRSVEIWEDIARRSN